MMTVADLQAMRATIATIEQTFTREEQARFAVLCAIASADPRRKLIPYQSQFALITRSLSLAGERIDGLISRQQQAEGEVPC